MPNNTSMVVIFFAPHDSSIAGFVGKACTHVCRSCSY